MEKPERKMDLTDQHFYEQAYSYFTYHAGQRTAMINYYIAVFGACLALYGTLLEKCVPASIMIGIFSCVVTVLFYKIDIRNRFDVKMSQSVICQFEQDYGMDRPRETAKYALGVFSNEDHNFVYYDPDREKMKQYHTLFTRYKSEMRKEKQRARKDPDYKISLSAGLTDDIAAFAIADGCISAAALTDSFKSSTIPHLSSLIKWLYYVCFVISVGTIILAVLVLLNWITFA